MKKIVYIIFLGLFLLSCYNEHTVDSGTYQCEVLSDSALYSNTSCVCQIIDFVSSEKAIIYYKSGTVGTAKIIQGVFSCNTDVNLVFSNGNIPGDDGQTHVDHATPDKSIFDINIIINDNQANRSKEYIASTIIHEILHAYMNYTGNSLGNDPQHAYMRDNYVNLMRDYLQTMYNINSTDATVLSLGGLEDYDWFPTLLSSRNISLNNYWQTKQDFKDKTSGTPCP